MDPWPLCCHSIFAKWSEWAQERQTEAQGKYLSQMLCFIIDLSLFSSFSVFFFLNIARCVNPLCSSYLGKKQKKKEHSFLSAYCHSFINLLLSFFLSGVSLLRSVSQVTAALKETSRPRCLHPARLSELDLPADRHLMYMYEYGWGCASFYWPVYCCSNIILVCGCQKDIFWTWCGRRGSQKRHYLNSPSEEGTVCQAGWDRRSGFVCAVCMCVRASMWFVVTNPPLSVSCPFAFWLLESQRG